MGNRIVVLMMGDKVLGLPNKFSCLTEHFLGTKYISCPKILDSGMQNQRKHDRKHENLIAPSKNPKFVFNGLTSDFHLYFANSNIFGQEKLILDKF